MACRSMFSSLAMRTTHRHTRDDWRTMGMLSSTVVMPNGNTEMFSGTT